MIGFNPRTYIRYDLLPSKCANSDAQFQSTYLHKVRLPATTRIICSRSFQSTYLHKVRPSASQGIDRFTSFNPRTYIRYDSIINNTNIYSILDMLLCETLFTVLFLYGGTKGKAYNMLKIRNSEHPCISVTTSGSQRLKLLTHHYKT